jgi:hypothetical protein
MLIDDPLRWDCTCGYGASVRSDEEIEKGTVAFSDLAILLCTLHEYMLQPSIFTLRQSELQNDTASVEAAMINIDEVPHLQILLQCPRTEVQEPRRPIVLQIT